MEGNGRAALFAAVFAALSGFLFLFSSPSLVCALYEADRLDQREGEGEGEGGRCRQGGIKEEEETERVRTRACAWLSENLVSVPAVTLSARKGGGDERESIGPLLSADGCVRAHTHTLSAQTRTDDTRGSGSIYIFVNKYHL